MGAQEYRETRYLQQYAEQEDAMGLGETQVFQDEKSRLANTTVARIVAAKGSLNDPETKRPRAGPEIHRPSSQTRSDALGAAGAATGRRQGGAGG